MPPQLRVRVAQAGGVQAAGQQQQQQQQQHSKDTTWSWLTTQRTNRGSINGSDTSFEDSLASSSSGGGSSCSSQEELCLSPLSQYFCNVEQPPDIYAVMTLDGYCTVDELVQPMQRMADLHDRFRRRLVYSFGAWKAEYLDDFDVRLLMREVTLEGLDAQLAFDEYTGQLMSSEPLGSDGLPPWDVICVHYASCPARTDVLMRASHIIGDGQLFMKLIKQIMEPQDAAAEADVAATVLGCKSRAAGSSDTSMAQAKAVTASSSSSSSSSDAGSDVASDSCEQGSTVGSPASSSGTAGAVQQHQTSQDGISRKVDDQRKQQRQQRQRQIQRRTVWGALGAFLCMIWRMICMCWHGYTALLFTICQPFLWSDPVTVVKASPQECNGPRKWSSVPLRLSGVHRTSKLLGCSINTLAVSCLAGGIRRYVVRHGAAPVQRVRLCSMVDTRSMPGMLTGTDGNSNNFSFIGVPLFTGDCSPLVRVARVGWGLSWIRHSPAVPLAIRMPGIIQFLFRNPKLSSWAIQRCLPAKATVGFSNMRGPAGQWALAGHPVARIYNGVQPNAFGCFVSLFSYNDTLTFTHTCYASKTDSSEMLLACIVEEYNAVRKAAALAAISSHHGRHSEPGTPDSDTIKAA